MTTSSLSHAGLGGYLLRSRIGAGAPRSDGALALIFDGNLRVLLHPAGRGELVLEAQLCLLPDRDHLANELLLEALRTAGQRTPLAADCLALDPAQDRLLLQQRVWADASADEFEGALAQFLDAVTAWRAHLGVL